MSETRPTYIPCASESNPQTDVLVKRHGDLIRLLGHPQIDLLPEDAAHLGTVLLIFAQEAGWDPGNPSEIPNS